MKQQLLKILDGAAAKRSFVVAVRSYTVLLGYA
jgi:hypothetical protein